MMETFANIVAWILVIGKRLLPLLVGIALAWGILEVLNAIERS